MLLIIGFVFRYLVLIDILKTMLDEQLKQIRKCHYQKYLNTKPIINNINKSNRFHRTS